MTSPRISTPRLELEPLTPAHAEPLYELYQDRDVSRFLLTRPTSREEFWVLHRHALGFSDSHGMWAVLSRGERSLIGRVGFFAFGEQARPELAFLLSTAAWGRGLATEACSAALRHAFAARPWTEVVALVRPQNRAAVRVLEKLGFSREADLQINGGNTILFQVARRQVNASRPTKRCS